MGGVRFAPQFLQDGSSFAGRVSPQWWQYLASVIMVSFLLVILGQFYCQGV